MRGDVHVGAFLQASREVGEIGEAGDAMPASVAPPLALSVLPGLFRGKRRDCERDGATNLGVTGNA